MDDNLDIINIYPTGLVEIKPVVQHYPWGLPCDESLVYRLYQQHYDLNSGSSSVSEDRWAELWIGTHPKGPSTVLLSDGQEPLSAHLKRMLSISPRDTNESEYLGFLLKVLSIGAPLSIQVHPDSILASQLYMTGHASITDSLAKSEFLIALTDFEALCSLRSLEDIIKSANEVPEFYKFLKSSDYPFIEDTDFTDDTKCYEKIISIVKLVISGDTTHLEELTNRLEMQSELTELEDLMLRIHRMHPNDPGIWFALLMNYVKLRPGDSFYVPPNTIHCYLSGTCIECMMSSDNVIRAGLTKKYVDPHLLPSCLLRTQNRPEVLFIKPQLADCLSIYKHEECHLSVVKMEVPPGKSATFTPPPKKKCSIAIIISTNENTTLSTSSDDNKNTISPNVGTCLLIYPNTTIYVKNAAKKTKNDLSKIFDYTQANYWFIMFIAFSDL